VHPQIRGWLETLGAPDIVLGAMIERRRHTGTAQHLRIAIARRGAMTVAATRHDQDVTVENVGAVPTMRALLARLLPLCGPDTTRPISTRSWCPPRTSSTDSTQVVRGEHTPKVALSRLGLTAGQQRVITAAADRPLMEMSLGIIRRDTSGDRWGSPRWRDRHLRRAHRHRPGPQRLRGLVDHVTPGTLAAGARA
jgi:hypothetical protein